MNSRFAPLVPLALFSLVLVAVAPAFADPLPGEVAKFAQLPLNGGLAISVAPLPVPIVGTPAPFPGHDELSSAYFNPNQPAVFVGQYQADDFADKFTTPVVHVQWWGSYMNQSTPALFRRSTSPLSRTSPPRKPADQVILARPY